MEHFTDLESIRIRLKRLDLERQISREQIKFNFNEYKDGMQSNFLSSTAFSLIKKVVLGLILKKFVTK